MTDYESISSKYKLKFYNFFLNTYLNRFGGYNMDHDQMVYQLSNFGMKVRPTYLSFAFGTKQENMHGLIDMLEEFEIFDIKQIETNIVQIFLALTDQKIKWLKYKRSKNDKQKVLKQMVLNCYRKIKDVKYQVTKQEI